MFSFFKMHLFVCMRLQVSARYKVLYTNKIIIINQLYILNVYCASLISFIMVDRCGIRDTCKGT